VRVRPLHSSTSSHVEYVHTVHLNSYVQFKVLLKTRSEVSNKVLYSAIFSVSNVIAQAHVISKLLMSKEYIIN